MKTHLQSLGYGVANTFRVNPPRRGFNNLYFNGLRKFNCLGLVG